MRDPPLHHRGDERKARDSNPHPPRGGTALAGRLGKPYPTTFRSSGPTGNRTRISATPGRRRPLGPWALRSPPPPSGPPGSRTPISGVRCRCRPVGPAARLKKGTGRNLQADPPDRRSARESNSVSLPTKEVCCRNTCRPAESRPGRTRTCAILFVRQASSPLDDGTICGQQHGWDSNPQAPGSRPGRDAS